MWGEVAITSHDVGVQILPVMVGMDLERSINHTDSPKNVTTLLSFHC